jgi:uncharacterized glyoxalase superfamily protein PhnB
MTWSAKLAPWLSVADAGRAVDFYKSAFGAVKPERLEGDVGVLQVARLGIARRTSGSSSTQAATCTPSAAARSSASS